MYVDAIDSDLSSWEEVRARECHLNGSQVYVLDEKCSLRSLQFETRLKDGFSLRDRKDGIKPMMNKITEISIGYTHTNSDGSSDKIEVSVSGGDKDTGNSSSTNNETDNASDTDSGS